MSRYIPNQNTYIGFTETLTGTLDAPTLADITGADDLTVQCISLTASAQGNTVPTPDLSTLFETSIPGTSTASFTADFYRDDTTDTAWDLLVRGLKGFFIISRVNAAPTTGDKVEVWPVQITSRAAGPISSNTAQVFTCTASVPEEPAEDATVAA